MYSTYSLPSTPSDRFLRNIFMTGLFTLRVFPRNMLRDNRRRTIFHIKFLMTDMGYMGVFSLPHSVIKTKEILIKYERSLCVIKTRFCFLRSKE